MSRLMNRHTEVNNDSPGGQGGVGRETQDLSKRLPLGRLKINQSLASC